MKDFFTFIGLLIIGAVCILIVPVIAFFLGTGLTVWFLWNCFKESRSVGTRTTQRD